MISAPKRCFSWESTTRTSAGPPRCRSSRPVRSFARFLSAGVTSTLRPVHSTAMNPPRLCLKALFTLRGRGDAQLLAVFRQGTARDLDPFRAELLHDPRVGMGAARVLFRDDLRDLALDRERGDLAPLRRVDSAVEEVLHGEEAARRVDVLVRDDA